MKDRHGTEIKIGDEVIYAIPYFHGMGAPEMLLFSGRITSIRLEETRGCYAVIYNPSEGTLARFPDLIALKGTHHEG